MTLGFTGTQIGLTTAQVVVIGTLFRELELTHLHHGDCIGADEAAHKLALGALATITIHPPLDSKKRAWSRGATYTLPEKPYLARNRDIVKAGVDGLIAAPNGVEALRSGTWATVRAARKLERKIWIVYRDGSVRIETNKFYFTKA